MKLRNRSHIHSNVKYPCANESILAVMTGLSPNKKDVAVIIGGSGDISFAVSSCVSKVYAVDINAF